MSKNKSDRTPLKLPFYRPTPASLLDDELYKVFLTAAFLAEHEGKDYVSTTTFVKALVHRSPENISDLFERLPSGAIPEPQIVNEGRQIDGAESLASLEKLKSFSPCINSAMENLTPKVDDKTERKLSSKDVFVDIARYSGGKSTQLLRSHGVSKEKLETLVEDLGWELIERDS